MPGARRERVRESRQAFLLELSDAIGAQPDEEAVGTLCARLLAEHLRADRCCFLALAGERVLVGSEYARPGLPPLGGEHRQAAVAAAARALAQGTVVCDDCADDPKLAARHRRELAEHGVGACIAAPVPGGEQETVRSLAVASTSARAWRLEEVALVEEVAARARAGVERVRAELEHRESRERLQLALDAAGAGAFVWYPDEDRGEPDARLLELFGLPADGSISLATALASLIHPDDRDRYAAAVARAADPAGSGDLREELRVVHPDGSERWVEVVARMSFAGEPRRAVRLAGAATDVTDRRQSERHQAFLLDLSDAMRAEGDEEAIGALCTRRLAEHLRLDRCYLASFDPEQGLARIGPEHRRPDLRTATGERAMSDFPVVFRTMHAETLVLDDVARDPCLSDADRRSLAALDHAALVVAAVRRGREVVLWSLAAGSTAPRAWRRDEVALIENVAERAWGAIESVRAAAALRSSEKRYRSLFDAMDQGVAVGEVIRDVEGAVVDLVVRETNDAYARVTGVEPATVVGTRARTRLPHLEPEWPDLLDRVTATGGPERVERFVADIGRWIDLFVAPLGGDRFIALFTDTTERRTAEEVLRASEARFRLAFAIESVGVLFFRLGGAAYEANDAFLRMSGFDRDDLPAGRVRWEELVRGADVALEELRQSGSAAPFERNLARADGSEWPALLAARMLDDESGILFAIDLTELRAAEAAAHAQAERRQQLEREFVANAAHELRTPLTAITAAVDALHGGAAADPERRDRFLGHLRREADRLTRLCESLLLLAQVDAAAGVPKERVPLAALLREAASGLRPRPGVAVEITADEGLSVVTNRGLLERVVTNLVENAAKHTRRGRIELRAFPVDGAVAVEVTDTGRGLTRAVSTRAFDRFYRGGARTADGFGLGLSIALQAALAVGGTLDLEPRDGGGTRARLELPG